jgi:plasmid stabilization system protein ParE
VKVELSAKAEADLQVIARWIALDNPDAARAFSLQLRQKCAALSRSPRRFPLVRQVGGHDLRKRVHGRYLIFYVIWRDRIEVVRIVHGARDWASLLRDE